MASESRLTNALVSVIIPAYNVEPWIEQCIRSVLEQRYNNIEIVIVDDGSTDGTRDVLQAFLSKYPNIGYFKQENQGQSVARNLGVKLSRGEILMFLDADDWYHPDAIQLVVDQFSANAVDLVIFQCAKYFDSDRTWASGTDDFYWRLLEKDAIRVDSAENIPEILTFYPLPPMRAIRREFLEKHEIRFQEGVKHQDNSFQFDVFRANPRTALVYRRLQAWRLQRPGQTTSTAHVDDAHRVVAQIVLFANQLSSKAKAYLAIAITKLLVDVASRVTDLQARTAFLQTTKEKYFGFICDVELEELESCFKRGRVQAGDYLLLSSFVCSTGLLSRSLGQGGTSFLAGALGAMRVLVVSKSFTVTRLVLQNSHEILEYTKGYGATPVQGLS